MNFIKKHKWRMLSFFAPLFILAVFFVVVASGSILNKDMLSQQLPLLQYFKNVFAGTASFPYTLSKGLGGGMYGTFFYYFSSPLNILSLLFRDLYIFFIVSTILKISLSGLTMNFFLSHKFKQNGAVILLFSIAYALMGYSVNYYINTNWLDAVVLAPIILIGIDKILDGKKAWLYSVSLLFAIIANYYIGFMLCFFSALYFIYHLLLKYDYKKNQKKVREATIRFLIVSFLTGLSCAFILLPVAIELFNVERVYSLSDIPFMNWNFLNYFASLYIGFGNMANPLNYYGFNIYSGSLMILLLVLYFKNSKIPTKEKRLTAVVYVILLLPITFNYLNYVYHMFSWPIGFGYRYSFLVTLFTLNIALKSYLNLEVHKKTLWMSYAILALVSISLMYLTHSVPQYYLYLNWPKILVTLVFVLVYILLLIKRQKHIALILVAVEIMLNLSWIGWDSTKRVNPVLSDYIDTSSIIEKYSGDKRLEIVQYSANNDSLFFNYNGVSTFLSSGQKRSYNFLRKIDGITESGNNSRYQYPNPVLDMLAGVEYVLDTQKGLMIYEKVGNLKEFNIYNNSRALALGYLVAPSVKEDIDDNLKGIFYQQALLNLLSDSDEDYFKEIEATRLDEFNYELFVDTDSPYIYVLKNPGEGFPEFKDVEPSYIYANIEFAVMLNEFAGKTLSASYRESVKFYYLELDKLNEFYSNISQNELSIVENTGNHIEGKIDVPKKSVLMLTIPYESGWTARVNGKKVDIIEIVDTFIGIELEEGQYTIELRYRVPGLLHGALISAVSLILLVLYEARFAKKIVQG